MLETVCHGRAHVDNTIYQAVAHLRKVLGDDVHQPRYIKTIAKKGYRLISPVTSVAENTEVSEIAIHSSKERRYRRRILAFAAGIASIAAVIVLVVNPQLRDRPLPADDRPWKGRSQYCLSSDMSEDGSQQYLSDGISEELIHVLSNLPDLRVTARTSSFAFRDSKEDIRQIGSKLNVATILEGSVRKDDDQIRVTSQLVDTRNGYHLWSQTFDRRTTDLFSIQSDIAAAVATTFELQELGASESDDRVAGPVEMQAYDHYLLGMHYLHKETASIQPLAIEYFERAIEADPTFARAYAGLSESYGNRYVWEWDPALLRKAESAAEYAVLLDDRSAEAFFSLGRVKRLNEDQAGSIAAYEKAIKLNPNHARAYARVANRHSDEGQDDLALSVAQKALELNPVSAEMNSFMGKLHYDINQDWDSVYPYFNHAMEIDPEHPDSYQAFGNYYRFTGQLDHAIP